MRRRGLLDAVELHEAVLAEASEQLSVVRALGIEEEGYEEVLKHRPLVVALLAVTERCEKSGRALDRRALELRAVELEFQWQMLCAHCESDAATQEAPAAVRDSGAVRATRFKLAQNIAAAVVHFEHIALDAGECAAVGDGLAEVSFIKSSRMHGKTYGEMASVVMEVSRAVLLVASFIGKVKRADERAMERIHQLRERTEMAAVERAQRRAEARVAREARLRVERDAENVLLREKWAEGVALRVAEAAARETKRRNDAAALVAAEEQRIAEAAARRLLLEDSLHDPWTAVKLGCRVDRIDAVLRDESFRISVQEKHHFDVDAASRVGDGDVGAAASKGVYADGGEVLLHTAAWHSNAAAVELLLRGDSQAEPEAGETKKSTFGRADATRIEGGPYCATTALHLAARGGDGATVRALLRGPAGRSILPIADFAGDTALHVAARLDKLEAVVALLSAERPKDPDPTVNERDPFWLAVSAVNLRGRSPADVAASFEVQTMLRAAEERLPRVLLVALLEVQRLRVANERLQAQALEHAKKIRAPKLRGH